MTSEVRPRLSDPVTTTDPPGLRPDSVSAKHLVFFVVSAAAPLTGMAGFVALAFLFAGPIVPAGYLVAGAVYALFAVGFTAMSRHIRNSGAFYAYVEAGLGRAAGGGAAFLAYTAYALGQVGFLAASGVFSSLMLQEIAGVRVAWQVCALAVGVLVAVLAFLKVTVGARVLGALLLLELGILFALAVAVIARGGHEGFTFGSLNPLNLLTPAAGVLFVFTFVMYTGFEQTAVYGEEARDPRRTVPRATYAALAVLTVVFAFISWIILIAAGPSRLAALLAGDPAELMFGLSTDYLGEALTAMMRVLVVTSFIAGVLAPHNVGTRYLYSLGRDRLLPAAFARVHPRTRTPSVAGVAHTALVLGTLAVFGVTTLDPYTQIIVWTNTPTLVGVIALEVLTSIAVIRFLGRSGTGETRWQRSFAPAAAGVLLSAALMLIVVKMDVLTGLGPVGNSLVLAPLAVAFIAGAVRAGAVSEAAAAGAGPERAGARGRGA
ncbi:APC family permease [Actinoplanes sp. NPDC023801]|uniref:APC family permease n=1 Tax=Actinoplanes sp. NPDC023801 TaxID=3154595 RepID=UPI0033EF5A3E